MELFSLFQRFPLLINFLPCCMNFQSFWAANCLEAHISVMEAFYPLLVLRDVGDYYNTMFE